LSLAVPIVYKRYEVSIALPIEYGSLNMCTVLSGLLFYEEHVYMQTWQLTMQIVGAALILLGIGIGRVPPRVRGERRHDDASVAMAGATGVA